VIKKLLNCLIGEDLAWLEERLLSTERCFLFPIQEKGNLAAP
jgi:hypothetical protein